MTPENVTVTVSSIYASFLSQNGFCWISSCHCVNFFLSLCLVGFKSNQWSKLYFVILTRFFSWFSISPFVTSYPGSFRLSNLPRSLMVPSGSVPYHASMIIDCFDSSWFPFVLSHPGPCRLSVLPHGHDFCRSRRYGGVVTSPIHHWKWWVPEQSAHTHPIRAWGDPYFPFVVHFNL